MADVLDTIPGVGWIAQVQLKDGDWVSWTQYTTQNGRTPTEARELARTHVTRLLAQQQSLFQRGRVVRADWIVEEVINPEVPDGGA